MDIFKEKLEKHIENKKADIHTLFKNKNSNKSNAKIVAKKDEGRSDQDN